MSLRSLWPAATVIFLLSIALVMTSGSLLVARKVVAFLILPAGMIWLVLLGSIFLPGMKRGPRAFFVFLWIFYSLAGSPYLGVALLKPLEKSYYEAEEKIFDLDALVLLGGGTLQSPGGKPMLGLHGDRVLRPAMLYHRGEAKTLITTGRSVTENGEDRLLSRETSLIWQNLDVPGGDIIEVPEPRNTEEELAAVAAIIAEHPEWQRVGLCSSASHLDRAMGDAREQGLELIPVPSDFRSMPLKLTPMFLIPQGRGFRDVQTALWEYLGQLL